MVLAALVLASAPVQAVRAQAGRAASAVAQAGRRAPQSSDGEEGGEHAPYGATGRAKREVEGARRLQLEELRAAPGALGDPWRAVEALPGVVPVLSGLPYFYLRGSPPSGTLYVYDDIPVPSLYHLAVGPAVIHPRMVGPLTLYSGSAPARYGRATGGVVVADGPGQGADQMEAELRLLDVSGYARTSALGGSVAGAVRYGYPALVLSLASPDVHLEYWDYQLRFAAAVSSTERLELVALGAHDALRIRSSPENSLALSYHRVEGRYQRQLGRTRVGAAMLAGWEQAGLGPELALTATRLGPRMWFDRDWASGHHLRLSLDMQAIFGQLSRQAPGSVWLPSAAGLAAGARARSVWGAQLELGLRLSRGIELLAGARVDLWLQAARLTAAADPRLRLVAHLSGTLRLHLAGGTTHQPAVAFVPLPGLSDLPLTPTLQSALQSEAGVTWDVLARLRVELQAFFHRYRHLAFTDTAVLSDVCDGRLHDALNGKVVCRSDSMPMIDRVDGYAYGAELFLRLEPSVDARLSGFVSYTLAFADLGKVAGLPYTPQWDVRHVANAVLRWRISEGWSAGFRAFVRSGKSHGEYFLGPQQELGRLEARMPGFVRFDVELAYGWRTSWGRMRLGLEWLNVTLAREPADLECSSAVRVCSTRYLPPIAVPNLSLRGEI